MGCEAITHESYPKQGRFLGRATRVVFNFDVRHETMGTIVRDDIEEPYVTIIQLVGGRYVLSTECQFSPVVTPVPKVE